MKEFIIDAQAIPPMERHRFIFQSFDSLVDGESLVIVNTHDPIPLLRQFQRDRAENFAVEYLEQGPKVWRLRLIKQGKESGAGFCGA